MNLLPTDLKDQIYSKLPYNQISDFKDQNLWKEYLEYNFDFHFTQSCDFLQMAKRANGVLASLEAGKAVMSLKNFRYFVYNATDGEVEEFNQVGWNRLIIDFYTLNEQFSFMKHGPDFKVPTLQFGQQIWDNKLSRQGDKNFKLLIPYIYKATSYITGKGELVTIDWDADSWIYILDSQEFENLHDEDFHDWFFEFMSKTDDVYYLRYFS